MAWSSTTRRYIGAVDFVSGTVARMTCWGFPKIRDTILGVPIVIRLIVFWGLDFGPPIRGN